MQINDFFMQCKAEFRQHFRESMGFTITQFESVRDEYVYTTLRATSTDWYTPMVDLMLRADGHCMLVVSGNNEDDELMEIGTYTMETRDIERFQIVLKYIMVSAVFRFNEDNKLLRSWGVEAATLTDEYS